MILKEILNRRSVREYTKETIPQEYIVEIIKAGQIAPTAKNTRDIECIVVKKQATKDAIFEITGQEFVKEAAILLIPVADSVKSAFSIQNLSVASENMFLQATALGVGSVWKNLRAEWAIEVKKILGIPEQNIIINIIPLGFPAKTPEPHGTEDFDERKIHLEQW